MRTSLPSRLNAGGLSIVVGTADEASTPSCCRAVAAKAHDDGREVTVYVPVATSQRVIGDLASNPQIAVVFSEPVSHETMQLKGTSKAVRLATADEKGLIGSQMDRFERVLEDLGMPRRVTGRINRWPAFAIELVVDQVFDQTPGPNAGREVR